jgi:hypothetical protein
MSKHKPCPFCGASSSMLYPIDITEPIGGFKQPAIFCDACKATVSFEDDTSTGVDDKQDYEILKTKLREGWNRRSFDQSDTKEEQI